MQSDTKCRDWENIPSPINSSAAFTRLLSSFVRSAIISASTSRLTSSMDRDAFSRRWLSTSPASRALRYSDGVSGVGNVMNM